MTEVGRNDPCPCGSGKKYKHCCQRKDKEARRARLEEQRSQGEAEAVFLPTIQPAPAPLEAPALSVPPDPQEAAVQARWEEFEAQDYEGQVRLLNQTLDEEELMDEEMAFEMLNTLYHRSVERSERDRFNTWIVDLRKRLPDVYDHDAQYYLSWLITNALVEGRMDALPALVEEMAGKAGKAIDTFNNVLDQMAYHGQLSLLVHAMRTAWPLVQASDDIVPWGVDEFALNAGGYEVLDYVEGHDPPRLDDPELIDRVNFFFEPDSVRLGQYILLLTGQGEQRWTMEDFKLEGVRRRHSPLDWDDEEQEEEAPDEGAQNLYDLTVAFLGYLRREEHVPYSKGELGRENLHRYILERHAGELEPQEGPFTVQRSGRHKRGQKARKSRHLLCPDRDTLDRFLAGLLHFFNPQYYRAAATFELTPAWLRFLESRRLIDAEQRAKTMSELRGMDTELLKLWQQHPDAPTLLRGLEGWRDE